MLLPLRDGKALFEGYLRLKDMPQGPRVFKFLVKDDTERYLPPEDATKLLRQAGAIYIARGEAVLEKKFLELLDAYQLHLQKGFGLQPLPWREEVYLCREQRHILQGSQDL